MSSFITRAGLWFFRIAWRLTLIVVVLIAIPIICVGLFQGCSNGEQSLPSPSGRWIVSKIVSDCEGPLSLTLASSTYVLVKDVYPKKTSPLRVFNVNGEADIKIIWNALEELTILVQDGYTPSLSRHNVGDLHIRYRVMWNPSQELHELDSYEKFQKWVDENVEKN